MTALVLLRKSLGRITKPNAGVVNDVALIDHKVASTSAHPAAHKNTPCRCPKPVVYDKAPGKPSTGAQ